MTTDPAGWVLCQKVFDSENFESLRLVSGVYDSPEAAQARLELLEFAGKPNVAVAAIFEL